MLIVHRNTRRTSPNHRSGTAIVAALMVVCVVAVLSVAYLQLSMSKNREQRSSVDAKRAFYIAEAGLAESFAGLAVGKSGDVANATIPARFANGAFWVEAKDEGGGKFTLTSTGMCGTGRSALSIVVEGSTESVGALGVFGEQGVTIGQGVTIDSYDSRVGAYTPPAGPGRRVGVGGAVPPPAPGARVGCNEDIQLPGGPLATTVDGDAQPGPQGSVVRGSGVTVTGSTAPRTAAATLPDIDVPDFGMQRDVDQANVFRQLVLSPQESSFASVRIRAGASAMIVGPATLVIDQLKVDSGAKLKIDATNGAVQIYVREYLNFATGSTYQSVSSDPTRVSLLVSASQTVDRDGDRIPDPPARIGCSGSFYGRVYAPQAALTLPSSLELFGGVAAQSLTIADSARIHFDRALVDAETEGGGLPQLLCWRLVELPDTPLVKMGLDPLSVMEASGIVPAISSTAHYDVGTDPLAGVVAVPLKVIRVVR